MRIVELPESWRDRALIVTDVGDPASWFAEVPEFRHEKRRREWMLSRIAEKELRSRGTAGTCTSFSHSGPFGAAAIGEQPIGIDVEAKRVVPPNAAHLFLTTEEEEAAADCALPNALLHFWSAKEARWKQLGGAVLTLKRVTLRLVAASEHGLRFDVVETYENGELVAALTLPTS